MGKVISRKVIGWALSHSLATDLVASALRQAIESRRPDGAQLLHHSDRGCQYTSDAYQQTLKTLGIQCSMSRTGCCYDNAVMERFFWSLKHEWTNHHTFDDLAAARLSVFRYIETFYNSKRLHQTLNYLTPNQYEAENAPASEALINCPAGVRKSWAIADENPATGGPALVQSVNNFLQDLSAGPADEAGQTLSFTVVPANPNLFTASGQPKIDASGNLTFQPKPNVSGTTTITVTATNSGGAAVSPPQTFNITITKPHKFHNAAESGNRMGKDVSGGVGDGPDGSIVAGDVLSVINFINAHGSGPVDPDNPNASQASPPYVDVNGDNQVVAEDALIIINYINANGAGEAEGEAGSSVVANDSFFSHLGTFPDANSEAPAVMSAKMNNATKAAGDQMNELIALLAADMVAEQLKRHRISRVES